MISINPTEEKTKIWIDKEGILNIKLFMKDTAVEVEDLLKDAKESLLTSGAKTKILVDISGVIVGHMRSSQLRKEVVKSIKEWIKEAKFEKAAVFGGDIIKRTITSFILVASGIKNIRVFETREKALKWLKK